MGILNALLNNYGDDIVRRAASNYGDDVLKSAARTTAKNAANYADDLAKQSAKQVAKSTAKAGKSTAAQKIAKIDYDDYLTSLGASKTLRQDMAKSMYNGALGKKPMIDRFKTLNVDLANVADKSAAGINAYGGVMNDLFDYMDNARIGVDLSALKKSSNLFSKVQKNRLSQTFGVDIDDLLKGKVTAKQANELYKMTRDVSRKLAQSNDATQSILAEPMKKLSTQIRDKLDDTASTVSKSFGLRQRLQNAADSIGDAEVARAYASMTDDAVRASMGRADMAPYMQMEDFIGLKAPDADTMKIMGIDTGLPQIGEKIRSGLTKGRLKAADKLSSEGGKTTAIALGAGGLGLLGGLLAGGGNGGGNGMPYMGNSTLSALTGDSDVVYGGNGMTPQLGVQNLGISPLEGNAGNSAQPTLGGYSYDDLENAYVAAIMAGDSGAAGVIEDMIDRMDKKMERMEKNGGGKDGEIAQKQQAAMSVLNTLMGNFQAQGFIGGNITNALNAITGGNYNYRAANYNEQAGGSLSMIIKSLGESGALAEGDVKRAMGLIPQITDSEAKAYDKYQKLMQMLAAAGKGG